MNAKRWNPEVKTIAAERPAWPPLANVPEGHWAQRLLAQLEDPGMIPTAPLVVERRGLRLV